MSVTYVQLAETPVLRVRADMAGKGPKAAFDLLESRLGTLKGRKFYGSFRVTPTGEEYFACVARADTDEPEKLGLESGTIPGGWYARRKLVDWESHLAELPKLFDVLAQGQEVDPSRPSLEFYRSRSELHLLLPVRRPPDERGKVTSSKGEEYDSRSSVMDDEGRAHTD